MGSRPDTPGGADGSLFLKGQAFDGQARFS